MPWDRTTDNIEADVDIRDIIVEHIDEMITAAERGVAVEKTLRRWLVGHGAPPDEVDELYCLMAMAADLELFTPSMSGRTMVDRHLTARQPRTPEERLAFQALEAVRFRLVRIVTREGPDLVRLEDLVSGERLLLLDSHISPVANGMYAAMRLCPLASGRQVVISPLFEIDETILKEALKFVRPGRTLGNSHRCAENLYRDVARRGVQPLPLTPLDLNEDELIDLLQDIDASMTPVDRLAIRWAASSGADADLIVEARSLASANNLVDALGAYAAAASGGPDELRLAYEQVATLQMETISLRTRAGLAAALEILDGVAAEIEGHIARGDMGTGARDLFNRLRSVQAPSGKARSFEASSAATADIDSVIQRIQGLRAKTVDRGCTEAEAIAAAAKISELLERHDLTLDEISVRQSDCEGVSVNTGRKRRAPVDSCVTPIAAFCDCRAWSEERPDGTLRYMYFGLKADVAAARFLHDLIGVTFESESVTFRSSEIYQSLRGGDRRTALNSFQIGLANGIASKLASLKHARNSAGAKTTGFDLVSVKHSVVDEEIEKLGLNFSTRQASSRRYVHGKAYEIGKATGDLFEPNMALVD